MVDRKDSRASIEENNMAARIPTCDATRDDCILATEGEVKRTREKTVDCDETQGTNVNNSSRETIRVDTHRTIEVSDANFRVYMQDIMAAAMQAVVDMIGRRDTGRRHRSASESADDDNEHLSRTSFKDVSPIIPQFRLKDGDEIERWIQRVEEVGSAYHVPEGILKLYATKQLRGRALDWFNDAPGIVTASWIELREKMTRLFKCREDSLTRTKKMKARVWRKEKPFLCIFKTN